MNTFKLLYQIGSTQVFKYGQAYGLYTICSDGRAQWMLWPAATKIQAIELANHYEAGR